MPASYMHVGFGEILNILDGMEGYNSSKWEGMADDVRE